LIFSSIVLAAILGSPPGKSAGALGGMPGHRRFPGV